MYKHIKNILITWLLVLSVGAFASTEITLNSTVDGALTEDSYIDADENRAEYYTFTLSEAKNIVLEINVTFYGIIKLKNDQGETLKYQYYDNERLVSFSKYLEAGIYSIKISNWSGDDFATFTLSYKENIKHIQPISLGQTLQGSLTENSYLDAYGNRAEYYTFTLEEAQNIVFDSNDTIAISLHNAQGEPITGGNYGVLSKYLEAGDYLIKVFDYTQKNFTLNIHINNPKHTQPISLDETLTGAITVNSYIDSNGYKAEYYAFTLDETQNIAIDSNTSYISLKNAQGETIKSAYHGVLSKYLEPGDYLIKIYSESEVNFTLHIDENHKNTQPISLGETLTGTFTDNSYIDKYGYRAEYYAFTLDEAHNIVIDANHTSYIELKNAQGKTIKSAYYYVISKDLEAGNYLIKVSSRTQDSFTLNIHENNKNTQPISLDETLTGEFTKNSYVNDGGGIEAYYSFTLTKSKDIVIQSHANFFTTIDLKDAQGNTIVSDSGSGSGHNALITTHLEAGNYSIKITPYYGYALDSFALSLNENIIEEKSITLNTLVTDRLTIDSGISPQSSNYTKYYTFTLTKATSIDMVLKSSDFLVKLYLLDSNNKLIIGSPDDYYLSTYSETINHNLEAGTYTVAVSTKYSDKVGAFTLKINTPSNYAWLIPTVYAPMLLN